MGEKANPVAYAARQSLRQNTPSAQRSTAGAVRNSVIAGWMQHPARHITSTYSLTPDGRFLAESASRHPGGGQLLSPVSRR